MVSSWLILVDKMVNYVGEKPPDPGAGVSIGDAEYTAHDIHGGIGCIKLSHIGCNNFYHMGWSLLYVSY